MEKKNDNLFEVVLCIVNAGFADKVMDEARAVGAQGGTIINASGTASQEAERKFGITVSPEKEIVMIVVEKNIKDDVLHALYNSVGLNTPGAGIAFSLPITDAVGLKPLKDKRINKEEVKEETK